MYIAYSLIVSLFWDAYIGPWNSRADL